MICYVVYYLLAFLLAWGTELEDSESCPKFRIFLNTILTPSRQ